MMLTAPIPGRERDTEMANDAEMGVFMAAMQTVGQR